MPFNEHENLKPSAGNGHTFECDNYQCDSLEEMEQILYDNLVEIYEKGVTEHIDATVIEYDYDGEPIAEHEICIELGADDMSDYRSYDSIYGCPARI